MSKTKLTLVLTLVAMICPLAAQDLDREAPPQKARKVVLLKHVRANHVATVLQGWVKVSFSERLGAVALIGPPDRVESAAQVIAELDVPRPQSPNRDLQSVELTVHFIGIVEGEGESFSGSPLDSVVSQLRSQFGYDSFRRLDSFLVRGLLGRSLSVEGALPDDGMQADGVVYQFSATTRPPDDQDPNMVELSSLEVNLRRRSDTQHANQVSLGTALAVPQGKLVVVGKAGTDDSLMQGLFVVLSARVVE